jgi:hypothetical protein
MTIENVYLFSKNLTQRHGGTKEDRKKYFIFLPFVPLCLCVIKFGLIAVLFLLPVFLHAQNSGYFYDSISGEIRFIHRLTWTEDENARRYEVIIEREEAGEYRELFQEFTTALFIEVPLLPGKYRCRVITYDFLNRPGPVPEWKYIEVFADLVYSTELRSGEGSPLDPEPVQYEQAHLEQAHLEQAHSEQVRLAGIPVDLFLSAAWMPLFTISDGGNSFFQRDMALSGAAVRFGAVWAENFFNINLGLELPVSYIFLRTGSGEHAHLLTFALNLLALKWLPGNSAERVPMAITFRLGAGYGFLFTNDKDTAASFSGAQSIHINAGVSFLLFVMDMRNEFRLYLETGLDYAHWFTSPTSYYFRPWLGIGWEF